VGQQSRGHNATSYRPKIRRGRRLAYLQACIQEAGPDVQEQYKQFMGADTMDNSELLLTDTEMRFLVPDRSKSRDNQHADADLPPSDKFTRFLDDSYLTSFTRPKRGASSERHAVYERILTEPDHHVAADDRHDDVDMSDVAVYAVCNDNNNNNNNNNHHHNTSSSVSYLPHPNHTVHGMTQNLASKNISKNVHMGRVIDSPPLEALQSAYPYNNHAHVNGTSGLNSGLAISRERGHEKDFARNVQDVRNSSGDAYNKRKLVCDGDEKECIQDLNQRKSRGRVRNEKQKTLRKSTSSTR
jgi:hypothetical protein